MLPTPSRTQLRIPCVHLHLDMADITCGPNAKCVAVVAPRPTTGPDLHAMVSEGRHPVQAAPKV